MSENGEEQEVKKLPDPIPGKSIFLSHCNTYEGRAIFQALYNQDTCRVPEIESHTFRGTVKKDEKTARGAFQEPEYSKFASLVEFERTKAFRDQLLSCDVIIYDLMSNDFEEVDYVIKTLKTSELTQQKTLVLLSSVMTWVNTPPKFTEEKVAEGEEEPPEEEAEPEEEEDKEPEEEKKEENEEGGEEVVIAKPVFFKETDYHLRVPHAKFQHLKTLETVAMSSVKTQPLLRVHVLCSGIRYGNGERTFYDHFQKAWIQDPQSLPVVGDGKNLVPTIHVRDLASLVRRVVIENAKEHPYIFAIDKTPNPTQKRIVQAISKGIGTGLIQQVSKDSVKEPWIDFLSINLKMKASDAFKAIPIKPEQEEGLEAEELEKLKKQNEFPWHTEKGIVKKISVLNDEFNQTRGLNPVKIMITGPPASGKTFYADQLAKYYNIPKVNVGDLLAEVWRFTKMEEEAVGENEQIQAIRAKVEELRTEKIEKMQEEYEAKKKDGDEDFDPEAVDRESLKIRIPDDILYKLL